MSKFNYANEIYNINNQAAKPLDMTSMSHIPNDFFDGYQAGQKIKQNQLKQQLLEDEIAMKKQENDLRRQYLSNPNENRMYEAYLGIKPSYQGHTKSFYPFSANREQNTVLPQTQTPVQSLNNTSIGTSYVNPFQNNSSIPTDNTINGIGYISPNRTDAYHFPSVLDAGLSTSFNQTSIPSVPQNNMSLENMTVNLSEPDRAYNALLMGDTGELKQSQIYARLLDDMSRNSGSGLWNLF